MNFSKEKLRVLVDNTKSKVDEVRYNKGFKVLISLSEKSPGLIYPFWDEFADYLDSDNSLQIQGSVIILANLVSVDSKKKFDRVKSKFFGLLKSKSFIVAMKTAMVLGRIAKARPDLRKKITGLLLDLGRYAQKHKELFMSAAITSFNDYFEFIKDDKRVKAYAAGLSNSNSPKAVKLAEEFLKRMGL